MKATKRIIAVALAVMILALMIPFAASAVSSYTANITGKAGYTITVYQIGTYNGTTYAPVSGVDTTIAAQITKADGVVPADLLAACEAAKKAGNNTGTKSGSALTFGASDGKTTFTTANPGIYYATVTATPAGVSVKKTGGCVFYLSDAKDANNNSMATQNIDMSAKIEDDTVSVSKEIVNGDMGNNYQTTEHVGDNVTFKLTASVTGTKDEYLTSYVIHDSMSEGLDFVSVDSVTLDETTTLESGEDYTVTSTNKADITIALTPAYLDAAKAGTNGFYDASNVVVTMKAKLNANAVHGRTTGDDGTAYSNTVANYNKDSLSYTNKQGVDSTVEGTAVHVYTFDVDIYKVDATDDTKKLDGATFTLTMGSKTYTATTENGGKASFTGLKKGTYTLKETVAPNGYNLNNTEYTVTIGADGAVTSQQYDATLQGVKIGDTPVVMPATGGPGTMMFTIIGASLIACAGILFIVIMRKKKSTK